MSSENCEEKYQKCEEKYQNMGREIQREYVGTPHGSDSTAWSPPPSVTITSHSMGAK